ncbi:MAG: thiamine pyrophosphate-binding protein [Gammaproteobacteria bacterium]|nr:thiamine pyrophosphate-binding protein [Gammaproteobacteria bacterium]
MTSNLAAIRSHEKSVADLIVDYLHQIGVEYVFGVPGNAMEPLYDSLARSKRMGGPRAIVARHETGAAFMAEGYTRETGKLGVCCTTAGPGATNIITGVASAYEERTPMLVITGQTPLPSLGLGAIQESSCSSIDIVSMFQKCTRYSTLVSHSAQLEGKLIQAVTTAFGPIPGPVHLSIPREVGWNAIQNDGFVYDLKSLISKKPLYHTSDAEINEIFNEVSHSKSSVILIGKRSGAAIDAIFEFAALTRIPVVATPQGRGFAKSYHPQFRGVVGLGGHSDAKKILESSSLERIIAVGADFNELDTGGWSAHILSDKVMHIDSTTEYFSRSFMAHSHTCGDLFEIFGKLIKCVKAGHQPMSVGNDVNKPLDVISFDRRSGQQRRKERENGANCQLISLHDEAEKRTGKDRRCLKSQGSWAVKRYFSVEDESGYVNNNNAPLIKPQHLMYELSRLFPTNTRFLADTGNGFIWAIHYLHPYASPDTKSRACGNEVLRTGFAFASMGWSIGAAVGTAMGNLNQSVVCIVGDGSFLMSGQEISVAVEEKLNITFILLNDRELGMIKHGQKIVGIEETSCELPTVNYCQIAKAIGAQAFEVSSADDLAALDIQAICRYPGPTLIDVHIDPDELPPAR